MIDFNMLGKVIKTVLYSLLTFWRFTPFDVIRRHNYLQAYSKDYRLGGCGWNFRGKCESLLLMSEVNYCLWIYYTSVTYAIDELAFSAHGLKNYNMRATNNNDPEKAKQWNADALTQRPSWYYGFHHSVQDINWHQWQTQELLLSFFNGPIFRQNQKC